MSVAATDRRHLLGLEGLSRGEVLSLLRAAEGLQEAATGHSNARERLAGRVIANLFFEDSTRTRNSFNIAAIRLGADTIDMTGPGSSLSKGETVLDTALTIEAMGVDALVVRSSDEGAPAMIADAVECSVINARRPATGSGTDRAPAQRVSHVSCSRAQD